MGRRQSQGPRARTRSWISTGLGRERTWSFTALGVVIALLLHASLFTGRGLVPADGVLMAPPWVKSFQHKPSNYLLADQYTAFLPVKQFFSNELRRGRFPLWNPHLGSGTPSLASMQAAALYPINLLVSPIGPFAGSGIAAFLKLFCAGMFTILYLRRLGVSATGATAAGIVYALSGFMIVWLGHPHVNAAVLLPLMLYFIERQLAEPGRRRAMIGFTVAYAAMLLGGHPPTAVHVTVAAALYFVFRLSERGRAFRFRQSLWFVAALVAGVALAAPQLLPYFEYYRESSSAIASAGLNRWASHLTPATLVSFVMPYIAGAPHVGFEGLAGRVGLGGVDNFNERTGYVGLFTLLLVVVALARTRHRAVLFHTLLAVGSLLVVYGVPPFPALMHALPVTSDINHQRLLLLVDFSAAVLAGFGLDALLRAAPRERPRRLAAAFSVAIVLVLALIWQRAGTSLAGIDSSSKTFLLGQLWIVAGGLAVACLVTLRRVPSRILAATAVGWISMDLLWFATGYNPAIPRDQYYPVTNAIRELQADTSHFRMLGLSSVLPPNTAAVFGLDDVRGKDFTTLRRYEELITGHAGDFFFYDAADRLPASFPLLNVKYVLTPARIASVPPSFELAYDGEIVIYRYTRAARRALVVLNHEVEPNAAAILARVRSGTFDPSTTVLLESPPAAVQASSDATVTAADAQIVTYEPDRVVIDAKLPRSGFLLLLDNFYPGWRAFAAGREVPILRADYTFRAVALPAGATTVQFVYKPASFRVGLMAALLAGVGLIAVGWLDARAHARP